MADTQTDTKLATVSPVTEVDVEASLQLIFEHLAQEGFRPKLDDDGSIGFKCEGWNIYLDAYVSNGGFRAYCCAMWNVDPSERTEAISIANSINAARRCLKVLVNEKNIVWVTHETLCADVTEYTRTLNSVPEYLISVCKEFREEFRRMTKPVTLN
jgi:hypothetical protein